jgi:hypothetical protein
MADRSLASLLRKIKPAAALCAVAALLVPYTALAQCAPPESVMSIINWSNCVSHAVDVLYNQAEPAETVARAAITTCVRYRLAYIEAGVGGLACRTAFADGTQQAILEHAVARVMARRAVPGGSPQPRASRIPPYDGPDQLVPPRR